jgi:2-C-methyl-D-erythritol 4-phosphate cytidylyltransferase
MMQQQNDEAIPDCDCRKQHCNHKTDDAQCSQTLDPCIVQMTDRNEIIGRNIQVCQEKGNAITAIYSNEAYMRITDGTTSDHCIPREELMRAQTPQTFPLKTLAEIMQKARELGVEHFQSLYTLCSDVGHKPLFVAEGDSINFKLTEPKDIKIYQALKDLIF